MIKLEKAELVRKHFLKIFFRVVTFLAIIYIFFAIVSQWRGISEWRPDKVTTLILFILAGIYGSCLFLLAEMWHRLILIVSNKSLPRSLTYSSYTETQVAKYLPGNVFHLIGRHAFLSSHGLKHRQLARAVVLEIGFLLGGAGIIAAAGLFLSNTSITEHSISILAILTMVGFAVVAIFFLNTPTGKIAKLFGNGIIVLALTTVFFLCQGLIFFSICLLISPSAEIIAVPSAALSWMAGYIVPGAPGGLGIREFVLLALGSSGLNNAELLIAVALFRAIAILGDLVCFALGRGLAIRIS